MAESLQCQIIPGDIIRRGCAAEVGCAAGVSYQLGAYCELGAGCNLGAGWEPGADCTLGAGCKLGAGWLATGVSEFGVDRAHRLVSHSSLRVWHEVHGCWLNLGLHSQLVGVNICPSQLYCSL